MIAVVIACSAVTLLADVVYVVVRGEEFLSARWHRLLNPEPWQTEIQEAEGCRDDRAEFGAGALVAELERAYAAYRRGEDVCEGAVREPSLRL